MLSRRREPHFNIDFNYDKAGVAHAPKHKWSIVIQDLLISCRIGVYPHEHNRLQEVLINLQCDYYAPSPKPNTDVSQVLCYDTLAKGIQTIANRNHIYF